MGENLKSYRVGLSWCRISFLPSSLPWPGRYRSTLSAPAHEDLAEILVSKAIEEIPFLIPLHSTAKKKKKKLQTLEGSILRSLQGPALQ